MGWTHGQNEGRQITEKRLDKETRNLQKMRKTTAKMGGLPEGTLHSERQRKNKVERKGQQQGGIENNNKRSCSAKCRMTGKQ